MDSVLAKDYHKTSGVVFQTLVAVCFCTLCIFLYNKRRILWLSWTLPGPFALPLIGNALEFYCDDDDTFENAVAVMSKYPSPMRFWFGPKFSIILTDTKQSAKIIGSMNFITKDDLYKFMAIFNGEGLISGSGAKWRRDRKLMGPLFLKKSVDQYFPCLLDHCKIWTDMLEKEVGGGEFNIEARLHRAVTDFVNETILGVRTDAKHGELDYLIDHFDKMYELVHARIVKAWLHFECIFKFTKYSEIQSYGTNLIHGFLRDLLIQVENRRASGIFLDTLTDQILDIRDTYPDFATQDQLVHHLCTLYSASEDTVVTITAFALMLFGRYQDIQAKVYAEIAEVLVNGRDLQLDDIPKLPYLDMCLREVLRLFPIAPFIMRTASDDFNLDGIITIPKGCSVIVSIQHIHRDPENYETPNEFNPEHFKAEAVEKRHPYAFIPFSAGPRGCLGKTYAYMAMKVILVTFLQKYRVFSQGTFQDIKLKTDISVRTRDRNYPIRLELRK